jgi:inhibitor of cysteine peptidase
MKGVLRMGQGGTEVWHFQALKPGKTALNFIYVRPWEKNIPPVKKQKIEVKINP